MWNCVFVVAREPSNKGKIQSERHVRWVRVGHIRNKIQVANFGESTTHPL